MMQIATVLVSETQDMFWAFALVFARISPIVFLLPALGEQMIPARVRLIFGLALTAIVTPVVQPLIAFGPPASFGVFLSETLIGLAYGASLKLMSQALLIAGTIAAQSTSLSQLFGGSAANEPQPALANIIYMAGLTLLIITDAHLYLVEALVRSYDVLPIGHILDPAGVASWGVALVADVFALGLTMAAAFVLAATLYNVAIGVVNKAMPQLMVSFVGAPAITAGGIVLAILVMPILLPVWKTQFDRVLMMPLGIVP